MYLLSDGNEGRCPDEYRSFLVARHLGIHPIDVDEGPLYWRERILAFIDVERGVDQSKKEAQERYEERQRMRGV